MPSAPSITLKLRSAALWLWTFRDLGIYALVFGIPLIIWWLAFYPGVMTADSLDQWRQALTHNYNDAHPFTSTLFMSAFRWLHDTPAWVSLTQVVMTSCMLAGFFVYAQRRGVTKKLLITIALVFILWPIYGIYSVTIWKDIIYSLLVTSLSLLCFALIIDKRFFSRRWPFALLALLSAAAALWRYNGIIYLLVPFVTLLLCNRRIRRLTYLSFGVTLVMFGIMHFGIAKIFDVQPAPLMTEWLRMKTVAAIYHQPKPHLTSEERKIFTSFMPESAWRSGYNCIHTDTTAVLFNATYRPLAFEDHVSANSKTEAAWQKAVLTAALHNPQAVVRDHACVGGQLLTSKPQFYKYAEGILVRSDLPVVKESPKLHTAVIKQRLHRFLSWSADSMATNFIFWSAVPATLICIIYAFISGRRKRLGTLALCLLALSNPLFVVVIGSSSDYRYIYSLILTAPLISIAYIIELRLPAAAGWLPRHSRRSDKQKRAA